MYNNIMTQGFFQFNNSIINEILNFTTSTFDLFFISGEKGSGKSETINKILEDLSKDNLVFQHFCFNNTVIDDFLLNFYDTLRNFSLAQKISLKKFTSDNFQNKISHYFKTIETPILIIIENFECIESNIEIINFLSHLASFENVKIIVLSRNQNKNLFKFKQIRTKTYHIGQISKEDFSEKLTILSKPQSDEFKQKFYEITQGLDLYLKMSIKYTTTTDVELSDLINEYERKIKISFTPYEEFLVSKFVSLVPATYLNFFKTLCIFSHPVTLDLLKNYNLAETNFIEYFIKNAMVTSFKDEFYVKDYFKNYILNTLSIQEKLNKYKKFAEIYEKELAKSPKDRLLRLSREAIRKEIELFNSLTPTINASTKPGNLLYLGINAINETKPKKSKLSEKLERIKERKKELNNAYTRANLEEERERRALQAQRETDRQFIINLINSARILAKKYRYKDAIAELIRAQQTDKEQEFAIEILMLLAKNYELLNNIEIAQKSYAQALIISDDTDDIRKTEIEFLMALLNKKLYKTNIAKTQFEQIAYNENNSIKYRAKAFIELGEINYVNSKDSQKAIKAYEKALELANGNNKELACSAYYRLAVIYDEENDFENAIKNYQKNYLTSSEPKENKYYSISLTNLAQIYIETGESKQAGHFLKLALQFDSENDDWENMYFSQIELARLYSKKEITNSIGYYKHALESARKLNDDFKEALVYFEVSELYYDNQNDEKALINLLNAKHILINTNQNENLAKVSERIKDIKMRLDSTTFKLVMEKYDK